MQRDLYQQLLKLYNIQYFHLFIEIMNHRVGYMYNQDITNYQFSKDHPMKTKRIAMAHSLIVNYQLYSQMNHYVSKHATNQQLKYFHDPGYINYLEHWVTNKKEDIVKVLGIEEQKRRTRDDSKLKSLYKVNQNFDCPGFDGLYNFCQLAVGGSIDAADLIISGEADIAINWAGGFHHAKKTQASGFCYVNDIVICILQLLKYYPRVLYLDIDVHHGDGVEQAFYNTNRVMTVSFHQYQEDFFPGTGSLEQVGEGVGKYYTVNVPLKRGMDDVSYYQLFKSVMDVVMGSYRPDVVVIQCGADSLSKDKLGHFNLSINGHSNCIKHMMSYATPLILLGGGGYTIQNTSRCWAYETGMILGKDITDPIPKSDTFYKQYEMDNYQLHFDIQPAKQNMNSKEYIERTIKAITQNIRQSQIRPSLAFHHVSKYFLPEINPDIEWKMIDENEDSLEQSIEMPVKSRKQIHK